MATAEQLRQEFESYMRRNNINYGVIDEADNTLAMIFSGDRHDAHILVDFDEAGGQAEGVSFRSESIAKCNGSVASALPVINDINRKYRWVKFWVTDDGDVWATGDALVYPGTVGEECIQSVFRMANIVEEALVELSSVATVDRETHNMFQLMVMMKNLG